MDSRLRVSRPANSPQWPGRSVDSAKYSPQSRHSPLPLSSHVADAVVPSLATAAYALAALKRHRIHAKTTGIAPAGRSVYRSLFFMPPLPTLRQLPNATMKATDTSPLRVFGVGSSLPALVDGVTDFVAAMTNNTPWFSLDRVDRCPHWHFQHGNCER